MQPSAGRRTAGGRGGQERGLQRGAEAEPRGVSQAGAEGSQCERGRDGRRRVR